MRDKNESSRAGIPAIACAVLAALVPSLASCGMGDIKDAMGLIPATSISVSPTSFEIAKGQTKQIQLTVVPSDSNETIYWKSYDTSVATVSDGGLVAGADYGWTFVDAFTDGHKLNSRVEKVKISALVSTIAGNGTAGYAVGVGAAARFSSPSALATDGTYLYVADTGNSAIRRIDLSSASVTNFAGTGSAGSANGAAASASFNYPSGITTDGVNLYIADTNNHMIRKIVISTGIVSTLAGSGTSGNLDGPGTSAQFGDPVGIVYSNSSLYVADSYYNTIRKIAASTGYAATLAGSGTSGMADGTGTAASFSGPRYLATDGIYLFVIDRGDKSIRKIDISSGSVATMPYDIGGFGAIAESGDYLIIGNGYRTIVRQAISSASWNPKTMAGDSSSAGFSEGVGALLNNPKGLLSLNGKIYFADTGNHAVRVLQ
jgi:hypothetical protein